MEIVNTQQEYLEYKRELDAELNKAADSFVKIGYLLRRAMDTDVLASSKYSTVTEFAYFEYGLSKDIVSRYININIKFSEGGYSDRLEEKYRGFGMSKLAEMLTLPAAISEALPDDLSKSEIRQIKKEYEEEQKITDIEVAIEATEHNREQTDGTDGILDEIVKTWLHNEPDSLMLMTDDNDIEAIKDIVAPSGTRVIIARIPGIGKLMATCNTEQNVEIVNMRTSEKQTRSWDDMCASIHSLCRKQENETVEEIWKRIYNEEYPKQEDKVTPHQEAPKEKRKPDKVVVSAPKKEKSKVAPVQQVEPSKTEGPKQPDDVEVEIIEPEPLQNQVNTQYDEETEDKDEEEIATDHIMKMIKPYMDAMADEYNLCINMLRIGCIEEADRHMEELNRSFDKAVERIKEHNNKIE